MGMKLLGVFGSVGVVCRLNGWMMDASFRKRPGIREEENRPPTDRTTVLPLPETSQAMPSRGARLLMSGLSPVAGKLRPLYESPTNINPAGAVGTTLDLTPAA